MPVSPQQQQMDVQLAYLGERADPDVGSELAAALQLYEQLDDLRGQWQANFRLASWHMARNDRTAALPFSRRAMALALRLQDDSRQFASLIQLGQLTDQATLFDQAARCARTDTELALAWTLMQRYPDAAALFKPLNAHEQPEIFGFMYYQYGKHTGDIESVLAALTLYRQAGNVYGVVDSLFLAAQVAPQITDAIDYAERALRAAEHLPDEARSRFIQAWLTAAGGD